MTFRTLRAKAAAAAALTLVLTLAACGGGGGTSSAGAPTAEQPVTVQVGFIPVIDVAALYLGQDQGIFARHGIIPNINLAQGGAALVPPVVSGEYQFAFSNIVSVIAARAQGLPLKIIATASSSTGEAGRDVSMIRVPDDSPIRSAADLQGKKVSVNTLNNLLQMLGEVAVAKDGGDPAAVQFLELPFPDAVTALGNGQIDAMVTAEPFDTIAAATGTRVIDSPYLDMSDKSLATSVYFTSEQQLQQNPQLFEAVKAAIDESLQYAEAHPDELRAQLSKFTTIDPAVIQQVVLPHFDPALPRESVDLFVQYAKQFGIVQGDVSYDDLVWSGAAS